MRFCKRSGEAIATSRGRHGSSSDATSTATRSSRTMREVQLREPDAGPAARQDRRQHRAGRGDRRTPRRSTRPSATSTTITGQKPVVTKAKKSIANFKLRAGMPIGVMVTLRGERMWDFLDAVNVALPRVRDFQGVPDRSFDGRGNYTLGLREQLCSRDRLRQDRQAPRPGGHDRDHRAQRRRGARLLQLLGMPFRQPEARYGARETMAKKSLIVKSTANAEAQGRRRYNRCQVCGRPRGYMRKFGLCRICFRDARCSASCPA